MLTETARDLAREIADLEALNLDDLRLRWQGVFGRAAPSALPRHLLLRLYIHRLQVEIYGDLSPSTTQLLDGLGKVKPGESKPIPLPAQMERPDQLKTGTVLVREHGGASHRVIVIAGGFAWNGET
jgi:hypothetical protein